ncbi:MAG: hypothetical protein SGJ18_12235 [Pseudomonadota bacterium]|nr:hypothetical protein [Pseudomonadota bacterium]
MKIGWVIRAEDTVTHGVIHTVLACSKQAATKQCEELRKRGETVKVGLISPYTEISLDKREVKEIESQDLATVFKEYIDLCPLLLERTKTGLKIEVDLAVAENPIK